MEEFAAFFIFMMFFWVILFAIVVLGFIFWIMMLIDAAQRDFKKSEDKIVWILVIALAQLIGAIIYYFVIKRKNKH
ncbi:PLDc N-terminal domain-containing protein [Candidatus Woesearchaeota archaeon]|nr:PLDc N-terminal domain-containing protein [Candidatus Woesearchaeota archaeon]